MREKQKQKKEFDKAIKRLEKAGLITMHGDKVQLMPEARKAIKNELYPDPPNIYT